MKAKRRPKRLKTRSRESVLLVALVCVAVVSVLTVMIGPSEVRSTAASEQKVQVTAELDMILVPTPTRSIARGERLGDVQFTDVKWPKNRLTGEFLESLAGYENSVANVALPKYLPIPLSAVGLAKVSANAVVEGIPAEMRAITVKVDAESAVEGWARPGSAVDVVLVRSGKSGTGLQAKTVAENVRILSAGSSTKSDSSGASASAPKTVTLLVSQEDALKVKAASSLGRLTFLLRGQGDNKPSIVTTINQREIFGGPSSVATKPKKAFDGYIKTSSGKIFVLGEEDNRWIQSAEIPKEFLSASSADEKKIDEKSGRAQLRDDASVSLELDKTLEGRK